MQNVSKKQENTEPQKKQPTYKGRGYEYIEERLTGSRGKGSA